jgi:NADH-quinone oxidoreductase subunit L
VAGAGLFLGWWLYRKASLAVPDPLARALGPVHEVLRRKYYVDEFYEIALVRPARWLGEVFFSLWIDRGVIDGFLHAVARAALGLGKVFRYGIDLPVVNGFGDLVGRSTKEIGRALKVIQTGRVQQYLLFVLINVLVASTILYYLLAFRR